MKTTKQGVVEILTFGGFDIRYNGSSLLDDMGRSYRILDLLKYFVSFKGRKLLPDTITNDLWEQEDFNDPKNVLRTHIFRLRKMLEHLQRKTGISEVLFDIYFSNGYYIFNVGKKCIIDYEIFEMIIDKADKNRESGYLDAKGYRQAIFLYRGEYMEGRNCGDWIIPIRNRYNRIYIKSIIKFIENLKSYNRDNDIIEICEEVLMIEPYEEVLNIFYMEALLKTGQTKQAMSHYEYITYKLYKELDIKPSHSMERIYKKIQTENEEKEISDLFFIEKRLVEQLEEWEGALFCDIDYFKFLYNLERRRGIRYGANSCLCLITISCSDNIDPPSDKLNWAMDKLKQVLLFRLRKGDVFSLWNQSQVIAILSEIERDNLTMISKRIEKSFKDKVKDHLFVLQFKFRSIISTKKFA